MFKKKNWFCRGKEKSKDKEKCNCHHGTGMSCVYGLGFIGAAVYYIQTATSFWGGVLGVLKALVWPAMVVYKFLGM